MRSRISATQAARTFSDLLNRVLYRGEEFVVVRGRVPVCEITGLRALPRARAQELLELVRDAPRPDDGYFEELATLVENQAIIRGGAWVS